MTTPNQLPRSSPEAQGIASAAIAQFVAEAEQQLDALHSLMLLRNGHVVAEGWWAPYAADRPHILFSLSKSFAATGIGLAVAEGRLALSDPVLGFFPEDAPAEASEYLAAMRVHDLLAMATGHAEDVTNPMQRRPDGNWARGVLEQPVVHQPGTHFVYNSGATYMLSAIIQHLTGGTLLEYLRPRLLEPLGITHAIWQSCPRGINIGGWGLSITSEAIARFGQLYLQQGVWHGQRLLPEAWVAAATSTQVSNGNEPNSDWQQGYGYQFWRCRHNAYRGDGAFGQFCVVLPEQNALLAITSGLENMQAVLNLVWERLLPAMAAAPLPADSAAHADLTRKLAHLALQPQAGELSVPVAQQVAGKIYRFAPNDQQIESLQCEFGAGEDVLTLQTHQGEQRIVCGQGQWREGNSLAFAQNGTWPLAASGAWAGHDSYAAQLCLYETPFCPTLRLRFTGQQVHFQFTDNVSFGPKQRPELVGTEG